jgi:hypothetical protein
MMDQLILENSQIQQGLCAPFDVLSLSLRWDVRDIVLKFACQALIIFEKIATPKVTPHPQPSLSVGSHFLRARRNRNAAGRRKIYGAVGNQKQKTSVLNMGEGVKKYGSWAIYEPVSMDIAGL